MLSLNKLHITPVCRTLASLMLTLLAVSCSDDPVPSPSDESEGVERTVSLCLQSEGFSGDDSGASRAIDDGIVDENTIKDFWLIEYDQNGNRIGFPRYYEYSEATQIVRIIVPTDPSHVYRGVILVNTHNPNLFDQENDMSMSEDRLQTMYDEIRQEEEIYTTFVGSDGKRSHYLPMSCVFDIPAPKNGEIQKFTCTLRRNVAKVVMHINTKNVTIDNVLWCNVPEKRYTAEQLLSFRGSDVASFAEAYSTAMEPSVKVLDWDKDEITAAQNALAAGKDGLELTYYLPRSCWGKGGTATQPRDKNRYAPEKATYYEIDATNKKTSGNGKLRYRIYPGTNATNDFNIIANCCYHVTAVLDADAIANDSRVEDLNKVRLAESNSYIIDFANPVTYEIPITRINRFWTNETAYPKGADNVLKDADEWVAEVIWQDQPKQMIQFCSADSDEGMTSYTGVGATSFYVRPVVGSVAGNVVIGVRRKPTGATDATPDKRTYLWSWHLWLTDYNPDEWTHAWEEGKYAYKVNGGEVHRYESSYWQTTFHNKYMMDRNLGAMTSEPGDNNANLINTFGMYYQYGRHEPLPYPSLEAVYDVKGVSITEFALKSKVNMVKQQFASSHAEAVAKPHTFFYCSNGTVQPLGYKLRRWYDGKLTNPYERNVWDNPDWYSDTKSLFDPCPPGWEVPDYGVYEGFASYDVSYRDNSNVVKSYFKTNSVEENKLGAANNAVIKGYHMYLNPDEKDKGVAWFPLAGCKSSTDASFYLGPGTSGIEYNSGPEGMNWMSVPINSDYCNRMDMTRAGIQLTPSFDRGSRSAACAVRCIRQ